MSSTAQTIRKGLHVGPGPWAPSGSQDQSKLGRFVKSGPTNLDLECKAALQQILKPSNFEVIEPWMKSASTVSKRDMVQLAGLAKGASTESLPRYGTISTVPEVVQNPYGRNRPANVIPCTADRLQQDLLRVRCGSEVKDPAVEAKRRYFNRYAAIPDVSSVGDFSRLKTMPVHLDEAAKVLSTDTRRKLQQWQVQGAEKSPEATAEMMRSMRSLSEAVHLLPTFQEHSLSRKSGGKGCTESLFEYSKVVPKGTRTLKMSASDSRLLSCRSAPILRKPFFEPEEMESIDKPGGYTVKLTDKVEIQRIKNTKKALQSKINQFGGRIEYETSYEAMTHH